MYKRQTSSGAAAGENTYLPLSGGEIDGDLSVTGNLTVDGTEVIVDHETFTVSDGLILLGKGQVTPSDDLGIVLQRYATTSVTNLNKAFFWDESESPKTFAAVSTQNDGAGTSITIADYQPIRMSLAGINVAPNASYPLKVAGNSYLDGTLEATGTITGDLTGDVTGDLTGNADSATLASTVTVQDTEDTAAYVALFEDATGSLGAKTDAAITYNAGTGTVSATWFSGSFTGAGANITNVDAATLDGVDGADFLQRAGAQVITGNKTWNDDVKAMFGTAPKLSLYHDGSNSHIKNTGSLYIASETSGDLYLRSDDDIFIQPQGGENGITLTGDGAVTLYHDASVRLFTTATGIDLDSVSYTHLTLPTILLV